jgi:hypothetical protein
MSDPGTKKVIVKQADLPPISSENRGYYVRYRLVSEDRNRISHWSPTYLMTPSYFFVPNNITSSKSGNVLNITWDPIPIYWESESQENFIREVLQYDVWVRWHNDTTYGDWSYIERISGNNAGLIKPSTVLIAGVPTELSVNMADIEVYVRGEPIQRFDTSIGATLPTEEAFLKMYQLYDITI